MRRAAALVALSFASTGCSLGLLQTGKTLPPGEVLVSAGYSNLTNRRYAAAGQPAPAGTDTPATTYPEANVRIGLVDRLDMGVGEYLGPGAKVDLKYDLLPTENRLAIAPRVGGGFVSSDRSIGFALAGVVASYDVFPWLTPYAGGTWVNHWLSRSDSDPTVQLQPNQSLVGHSPGGDGLLQMAGGVSIHSKHFGAIGEVGRWLPMQDDPGDGFRFVATTIVVAGFQVCTDCR